jgi:hypothetical protein
MVDTTTPSYSRERPSPRDEAGAPEVEITPAMIEAGVRNMLGRSLDLEHEDDIVVDIYRAMETVRILESQKRAARSEASESTET